MLELNKPATGKVELKGVKRSLVESSKRFQNDFMDQLEALPKYEIDQAKEKCTKLEELVYNIKGFMKMAEEAFDTLLQELAENVRSDENPEGLLIVS